MLIYKINFSILNYIFCGHGLKGRAPEKDENEDAQLYFSRLVLVWLLLFAINA